jgi:hypothetical protein
MPSPFPGMDSYLEGYLWPDVHHRLATQISDQLMPMLRPRYVVRIEIQMVQDATSEADIGIMYPDVEVVRAHQRDGELPPASTGMGARTTYDRAAYDLSLNYAESAPPPPLSTEEQVRVRQRLSPSA